MKIYICVQFVLTCLYLKSSLQDCPGYLIEPTHRPPINVSTCTFKNDGQGQYCDSCCPNGAVCCDNGTCMAYDPYCRYPTTCCKERLCGIRCCGPNHGTPCGDFCAPKNTRTCCNPTTGKTCPAGSTCCENYCCASGTVCCNGRCCGKGEVCDNNGVCCASARLCNATCCARNQSCSNQICCFDGQSGCGFTCCLSNEICSLSHCCPKHSYWCETAKRCCSSGQSCIDGTCCNQSSVCGNSCCAPGQLCISGTCLYCPQERVCEDKCCRDGEHCQNGTCKPICPLHCGSGCCNENDVCRNGQCLPCNEWCGNTTASCCIANETCSVHHCCQSGHKWCSIANKCCQQTEHCFEEGCCDVRRLCSDGSTCCPRGHICKEGTVCCEEAKVCGDKCCLKQEVCRHGHCVRECRKPCGEDCCGEGEECCNGVCCPTHDYHCHYDGSCCRKHEKLPFCGCWLPLCDCICRNQKDEENASLKNKKPNQSQSLHQRKSVIEPSSFPCFQHADEDDACSTFACLDDISSCREEGYLSMMHQVYCTNAAEFKSSFNAAGQYFLDCAAGCLSNKHLSAYREGVIPCCSSLNVWGTGNVQEKCYKTCKFCDAYMSNTYGFIQLYNNTEIVGFELYYQYCNV